MPQEPEVSQWWYDDHVWLDLFNPTFHEDEDKADRAAKLFHGLLAQLQSGPEGVTRAKTCLENALRLTFPFTRTYHECRILYIRILYMMSLGDDFPSNLGTMELLTESMKRTKTALQRASAAKAKRRPKRPSRP